MFHMLIVAVDPFSVPSAWIVETASRIFAVYEQSDCRVAWLVGGDELDATEFLGRWGQGVMTFADPDLAAIKAFGFETLPAVVHLAMDGTVAGAVEGWDPVAWRELTHRLSRVLGWSEPAVPALDDPAPFEGAPVGVETS